VRRLLAAFCCWAILGAILPGALTPSSRLIGAGAPVALTPARPGWLGLNGNTSTYLGPVDTFSKAGVVFDRNLELQAGRLPGEGAQGTPEGELVQRLAEAHALGMSPVAVVDYRGYGRPGYEFREDPEFPSRRSPAEVAQGRSSISAYVAGFVRSATAIRRLAAARFAGTEVRFEVINEPWGYTSPQYDPGAYAEVLAALLPAATAAGIPARDIYAAATGEACSPGGCRANEWVAGMYRAEPALRQEIEGWYLHPYGPPTGVGELANGGIQAVPLIRSQIASGRDNLIVSELGFCARDVNNPAGVPEGVDCHGAPAVSATQAAGELTITLEEARVYHREGWLRALIVYSRNDGGWAMQLPGGTLTPSGRALLRFAAAAGSGGGA
jgi:hypothetical protein